MSPGADTPPDPAWPLAMTAAALFAVDPDGLRGISLRAPSGPVRDRWLALLRGLLPDPMPVRRVPAQVTDGALLGGLDLPATLRAGRPVVGRGLLAEAHGGVLLLSMAERLPVGTAALLCAALDSGAVLLERDGLSLTSPARLGMVALDEGIGEEQPPQALTDRLAFPLDLTEIRGTDDAPWTAAEIDDARALLPMVEAGPEVLEGLCATALALGVWSLRASMLALRAACAAAALDGRTAVSADDAALAARLVLAPRATQLPAVDDGQEDRQEAEPPPDQDDAPPEDSADPGPDQPLADVVLAAAQAAIPPGLLARLQAAQARTRSPAAGRAGAQQNAGGRGRPVGARRGEPRGNLRLNLLETLRAAAPWQPLRRAAGAPVGRVAVRKDDFRVTRLKRRTQTATIFVVDASGSAAFQRLAEAKGAVELLLGDCYVRRDQVALVAFRGQGAELLLPPTRSLVRAKRSLAGLPGGGGTPLAAGLDAAAAVGDALRRRGVSPTIVVLTDGRGNVARDGSKGRAKGEQDALLAAKSLRAANIRTLLLDTSPYPEPAAQRLAGELAATYLFLPQADAAALSGIVRAAAPAVAA